MEVSVLVGYQNLLVKLLMMHVKQALRISDQSFVTDDEHDKSRSQTSALHRD